MDTSEIYSKRLNAKEVIFPKQGEFIFPIADGRIKTPGGDHVKSIPPTTDNWLRKLYIYSLNNDTSTEDKHETNHINNKYNDMNMNTRNMHNT